MRKVTVLISMSLVAALAATMVIGFAQNNPAQWPAMSAASREAAQRSLDRGLEYLRKNQKPNGSFENHEGLTGLAVIAFLQQPGSWKKDEVLIDRALQYMTTLQKPDGAIYSRDKAAVNTAIAIMAMALSKKPQYQSNIKKGQDYLVSVQYDDGEGAKRTDAFFGGFGYDGESRPDLNNLHHMLEALKVTAVPKDHPVWDKAIQFIQRTQNRKASNDQAWSVDDGGFVYRPGESFAGGTRSYGSMTYAGLISFSYANLAKTDRRVQDAYKWLQQNYTVEENPGLGKTTLYYYYMILAKGLRVWGEPYLVDSKGQRHDWRDDLAKKLAQLQHADGYWVNLDDPSHMQDNKVLVTSFTSIALDYVLNDSLGS